MIYEKENTVLSAEAQLALTPDRVIEILQQGNTDFINNKLTVERVSIAAKGQFPEAVVLSCMDSRLQIEDIFHCGIGDIFVIRVAGNIVNPDILGSLEFACSVSGAKLVVVLGHGSCCTIKMAIDNFELGNITGLLEKIKPAVIQSKVAFAGETTSSNPAFVETVCLTNVGLMVNEIRKNSPILKAMEERQEIRIVGAFYNMDCGKVVFEVM